MKEWMQILKAWIAAGAVVATSTAICAASDQKTSLAYEVLEGSDCQTEQIQDAVYYQRADHIEVHVKFQNYRLESPDPFRSYFLNERCLLKIQWPTAGIWRLYQSSLQVSGELSLDRVTGYSALRLSDQFRVGKGVVFAIDGFDFEAKAPEQIQMEERDLFGDSMNFRLKNVLQFKGLSSPEEEVRSDFLEIKGVRMLFKAGLSPEPDGYEMGSEPGIRHG